MSPVAEPALRWIAVDDAELDRAWTRLGEWTRRRFRRELSVEAAFFLVGIQARGRGFTDRLRKEEKQDLIMEGTWLVLESAGMAARTGPDGTWERLAPWPSLDPAGQEKLLKAALVEWFAPFLPEAATVGLPAGPTFDIPADDSAAMPRTDIPADDSAARPGTDSAADASATVS